MNTVLKQKTDQFNDRSEKLKTLETLLAANRYFYHLYKIESQSISTTFNIVDIANEASFLFGFDIKEIDIQYVANMYEECCYLKINSNNKTITFPKGLNISQSNYQKVKEETIRHFSPDSDFYKDIKLLVDDISWRKQNETTSINKT